jgi:hypothetical protein
VRKVVIGGIGVLGLLVLGACGSDNFRDVEGVKSQEPERVEVYSNVNGHPNITRVCIDGVAFATTTRDHTSIMRVEEWDKSCPGFKGEE